MSMARHRSINHRSVLILGTAVLVTDRDSGRAGVLRRCTAALHLH